MEKVLENITIFNKYRYLIKLLIVRDIKKKYKDSFLGIIWSLLNPLLQMIVLTIIFSSLFDRKIDNFPLYLITGRLVFDFFSLGTNRAMNSIIGSSALIKKVYIPKYVFTLSSVTSNLIIFCISLVDLLLVMIITNAEFSINMLLLPVYIVLLYMFVLGVSYMVAVINTIFRDVQHIYGILVMILMYMSAIFYPSDIIPQAFRPLLTFNPVFQFIDGFRKCVYYNQSIDMKNLLICAACGVVSLLVGMYIFNKNQDKLIFYL